jgi:hypothetical protein
MNDQRAAEVLGLEHENARRPDQDVIKIASTYIDVMNNRPTVSGESPQRLGGRLLTLGAAPPPVDVVRRRIPKDHGDRHGNADTHAGRELEMRGLQGTA